MTTAPAAAFDPKKYTAELKSSWSDSAGNYDRLSFDHFSGIVRDFVAFADLDVGINVLDVACGTGLATLQAADKVLPSGRVTGVDLAPGMLALARLKAKDLGLKAVEFREMNAERLEFPDASFDAVICHLGLMLFADPAAALKEMVRVVKKGGSVSCLVQGVPDKMIFTSLVMKCAVKHAPELKAPPGAPTLYGFGPPGVLEGALADAGLSGIKAQRPQGAARFPSPEAYWDSIASGAGKMRAMLESVAPEVRDALRKDVLSEAAAYAKDGGIELPIEMAMARGLKP